MTQFPEDGEGPFYKYLVYLKYVTWLSVRENFIEIFRCRTFQIENNLCNFNLVPHIFIKYCSTLHLNGEMIVVLSICLYLAAIAFFLYILRYVTFLHVTAYHRHIDASEYPKQIGGPCLFCSNGLPIAN